jgi:uncharacterized membrane protein YgdD (TMEM256/DUF423 family)
MGAFGAHALKEKLSEYSMLIYDKAVFYQVFHAIGILVISILGQVFNTQDFNISGWLFVIGIVLFSGSLFILSVTGIKWLGAITPIGGMMFIAGWFLLFFKVLRMQI